MAGEVKTCDLLQHSRIHWYNDCSCSWSSSRGHVCLHSALTWKLLEEDLCAFATPGEYRARRCRKTWTEARGYDRPCRCSWNDEILQHTKPSYSPDEKFDVDHHHDCIRQEGQWTLAILWQPSTLSTMDLDRIHHVPLALVQKDDTYHLSEAKEWIPNALCRSDRGEDHTARLCCPWPIEHNGM